MSLLYTIFIHPLEMGMRVTLEGAYGFTGSYGWAIVALSVIVNIVLLPLYALAEKWQNAERRQRAAMAPEIDEVKAECKGEERFNRIAETYKRHGYHPIMAMRGAFGFLIQVPFFIAAYSMLSEHQGLPGHDFWLLSDLGRPDGLLWGVNALPLVMTVVNLISAGIYAHQFNVAEQVQLWLVAGFFLYLLYSAPSGLVLYWTLNNVFSLGKNAVMAQMNKRKSRLSE